MIQEHIYICPYCGEENDEHQQCCHECWEELPGRWDIACCGDCGEEMEWIDGGWYCENCDDYPDTVYHEMED